MTLYATLYETQWTIMLDVFGVAATLTDSGGEEYSVTGVLTPRNEAQAMDASWEEISKQAEFTCVPPDDFVFAPRECSLLADGVTYTLLSESVSNGATHLYLCERTELTNVIHRGRRY